MNRDKILFLAYAVASAAAGVAASRGFITADELVQVQSILTAFGVAFHIPDAKAAAALREQRTAQAPPASVE